MNKETFIRIMVIKMHKNKNINTSFNKKGIRLPINRVWLRENSIGRVKITCRIYRLNKKNENGSKFKTVCYMYIELQ